MVSAALSKTTFIDNPHTKTPQSFACHREHHCRARRIGERPSPNTPGRFVEILLSAAADRKASDVHLQPTAEGLDIAWRIDGVLQPLGRFQSEGNVCVVTRLKVMAGLLTYHNDVPQEGRLRDDAHSDAGAGREMRISTFPTLYGERAVVRLFDNDHRLALLSELGYPR